MWFSHCTRRRFSGGCSKRATADGLFYSYRVSLLCRQQPGGGAKRHMLSLRGRRH
ncbi:hypothetical protein MAR_024475 [Mya arenaria]|uniref:Uncharacterized protein n=1 Tax=Mya arenaria TaxID=6604 RepID=A0ABY7DYX2_MYAAR|nr:hypothetical protein MAR_024473 [Mya arenaria]WAR00103.1 hypothetical protein MAR_024475 [Mya arenaria]